MPLHLLGKKSWNVYNADNVARVRRDEAEARAREEAEEQRMQQEDAERRLAILRGEVPPPLEEPPAASDSGDHGRRHRERDPLAGGRKRKRAGEDDTDFEMRVARERAAMGESAVRELSGPVVKLTSTTTTSIIDSRGHITLFGEEEVRLAERNQGAESEAAKKKREEAEQHQVRFTSAAGRDAEGLLAKNGPWYATPDGDVAALVPSKNVFGKEDPGRKAREVERLSASDPLAMMKRGAKMVRDLNKERERENEDRERALKELRKEERRREKRMRTEHRRERDSGDESDGRRRSRSERRDRDHDRDRSRDGHRHRDRHHDRDRDRERSRRHDGRERHRDRERSRERGKDGERRRDHSRDRQHRRSSRERDNHEHRKHRDRDGHDGKHDHHRHNHRSERSNNEDKSRRERDGQA